jgi:hypothetical protein
MTMAKPFALAAGILILGVALVGCTPESPHASPTHSATESPSPKATGGVVTKITTQPGTSSNFVGALADVTVTKCDVGSAPATIEGSVTNPKKTAQSYRIYVSILTPDSTIGVDEVDVNKVAPLAKKSWAGSLDAGAKGARCVLRVERSAAG